MGALALIEAALKRARGTKTPQQLRKQDLLEALETSEEDLLGRGMQAPQEVAMQISGSRLGDLLRAENIGLRVEPNLPAFSPRAHFDATGGQQLPFLSDTWQAADPLPRNGVNLRALRLLDMGGMPPSRAGAYTQDPFIGDDSFVSRKRGLKPYGLYINEVEGQDFLDYEELSEVLDPDTYKHRMPSFQELLRNADLRARLNMSGYVPRRSELFRKPLILAKKRGGSVK